MKSKLIKSLAMTLLTVLTTTTVAFANTNGTQLTKQTDDANITITFANEKIKTGDNDFTISLLDKNGNVITNSNLKVTADMDRSSMGNDGMEKDAPMMIDLKDGSQKGEYTGMVNFKSQGDWIVTATYTVQGQEKNVTFNVNVKSAGPNLFVIGSFAGIVVIIIAVAAIYKKKSKKA